MLYDLNVPWSPNQSPLELGRTVSFLSELGYDTLALNHEITGPVTAQISNPIPSTPPFKLPKKTILLRRCTLHISDPSHNYRLSALSTEYDLLALRPTTEKAFSAACLTIGEHSIISLDLTHRYPFHFKPKPFMTAVNRGIRFEICYAQATMEDANGRRNFVSNCLGILRATKGRGLVVSSGATGALGVRGPADVLNLLSVWGLSRDKGMEALGVNPRAVVINEGLKRTAFRGVIDVIEGGAPKFSAAKEGENTGGKTNIKQMAGSTGKKGSGKRVAGDSTEDFSTPTSKAAKKAKLKAFNGGSDTSLGSNVPPPGI